MACLVSHFAVKNTQALINMRDDDAHTVCLATLNFHNFIVYGQKK